MDYLSREASPLPESLWQSIDSEVVRAARRLLTGRRFLHVFGPLGIGVESVSIDNAGDFGESDVGGMITTRGRRFVALPILYSDFTLLGRDIQSSGKTGYPPDLSGAAAAAEACAVKEDQIIFFGSEQIGLTGLINAPGAQKVAAKDWAEGENAFTNVAAAIELLAEKGIYGRYALSVSPNLYMKMQRLQAGTGLLEIDRVGKLVGSHIYKTPVLKKDQAVLVCAEPRNMDLVIGQDMAAAYLEQKDLNHSFRVLESVLPRVKREEAIVVLG